MDMISLNEIPTYELGDNPKYAIMAQGTVDFDDVGFNDGEVLDDAYKPPLPGSGKQAAKNSGNKPLQDESPKAAKVAEAEVAPAEEKAPEEPPAAEEEAPPAEEEGGEKIGL